MLHVRDLCTGVLTVAAFAVVPRYCKYIQTVKKLSGAEALAPDWARGSRDPVSASDNSHENCWTRDVAMRAAFAGILNIRKWVTQ